MPSGVLGAADLAAATNTTIYTVPASRVATVNINICNRGTSPVKIRLAVSATASPAAGSYIEYDANLAGNGVLERTGFVLEAGRLVVAYSDLATVSVVVHGFEE